MRYFNTYVGSVDAVPISVSAHVDLLKGDYDFLSVHRWTVSRLVAIDASQYERTFLAAHSYIECVCKQIHEILCR